MKAVEAGILAVPLVWRENNKIFSHIAYALDELASAF
jgi:hypothetical protein